MLRRIFGMIELLALGIWLGSILFFALVTTPTAFQSLEGENAGLYIRAVFPSYYVFGVVTACIALVAAIVGRVLRRDVSAGAWVGFMLMLTAFFAFSYARMFVRPRVEEHREARAKAAPGSDAFIEADQMFRATHRLSVLLNGITFVTGLGAFVVVALTRRDEEAHESEGAET